MCVFIYFFSMFHINVVMCVCHTFCVCVCGALWGLTACQRALHPAGLSLPQQHIPHPGIVLNKPCPPQTRPATLENRRGPHSSPPPPPPPPPPPLVAPVLVVPVQQDLPTGFGKQEGSDEVGGMRRRTCAVWINSRLLAQPSAATTEVWEVCRCIGTSQQRCIRSTVSVDVSDLLYLSMYQNNCICRCIRTSHRSHIRTPIRPNSRSE